MLSSSSSSRTSPSNRPNNTRATPVLRNVCTRLRTALVLRLRPTNVRDANPNDERQRGGAKDQPPNRRL